MPTLPAFRIHPGRLWIAIPAIVAALGDAALTLLFQPPTYWAGTFETRSEVNPLGSLLLQIHPLVFVLFLLAWNAAIVLLVLRLRGPWHKVVALTAIIAHTAGTYGWLQHRSYVVALPIFVGTAILTVFSWRRADRQQTS